LSGTLISPYKEKRFYEKVYLILISQYSPLYIKPGQKKENSVCSARSFSTLLQQSTNRWNSKTLAADNTDITTQIHTDGLTNNLEAT
jgi:hypothetical protein